MEIAIKHSNIDQMKMKYQKTYSEDLFDITHAPSHQCPNIDALIKMVRTIEKLSSKVDRLDEDELRSALDDINSELWNTENDLEKVRTACENVREWGQGWKDKCKEVFNDLEDGQLENYI